LLLIGYEQFKHLRKTECAECIKQNILPIRTRDEIGRKITELFRGQDRKEKTLVVFNFFAESVKPLIRTTITIRSYFTLAKKMAQEPSPKHGLNFTKERDYKAPLEKSENNVLPSIYTITIERLKMAKLLKESKKITKTNELQQRQKETTVSVDGFSKMNDDCGNHKTLEYEVTAKHRKEKSLSSIQPTKALKRAAKLSPIVTKTFASTSQQNTTNTSASGNMRVLNVSDINSLMPQFSVPTGFTGTILIQPTIHIHTDHDNIIRYRGIVPRPHNSSNSSPDKNSDKRRKI
jgi:hypothetical protein